MVRQENWLSAILCITEHVCALCLTQDFFVLDMTPKHGGSPGVISVSLEPSLPY